MWLDNLDKYIFKIFLFPGMYVDKKYSEFSNSFPFLVCVSVIFLKEATYREA